MDKNFSFIRRMFILVIRINLERGCNSNAMLGKSLGLETMDTGDAI